MFNLFIKMVINLDDTRVFIKEVYQEDLDSCRKGSLNNDIKASIKLLINKNCDIVCCVYKQHHNPYFNMMESNSKGFLKFLRIIDNIPGIKVISYQLFKSKQI